MKAKSIIYLVDGARIKTADSVEFLIRNLDHLPAGGTLHVSRLTDHGTVRDCYVPAPTVIRLEAL